MSSRGKKRERELENQADKAVQQWQPSPLEQLQEKNTLDFITDWNSGKDVKDIKGLSPYMNLYENAKNSQDAEKLGGGAFNLSGEGGGKMAEKIRQQNSLRKEQDASGQLYNTANTAYSVATNQTAPMLMQMSENRAGGKANLANQRVNAYYQRPQQQSPWLQALGMVAGGSGWARAFKPKPTMGMG